MISIQKTLKTIINRVQNSTFWALITRPLGCDRPHRARDCPKKEKLNAIIAEDGENNGAEVLIRANPL